jgi:sortase A
MGLAGTGVWAASKATLAVWQDWGNWAFDTELHGDIATVRRYLAAKADQLEQGVEPQLAAVEAWLGFTGARASVSPPRPAVPRLQKPPVRENSLVGRITIPRLNVQAIVREGVGRNTLSLAAGHIPGTALPGEKGNVAVAAHRDTLFQGLKGIRPGDAIQFETVDGTFAYKVEATEIVKPDEVAVLNAGRHPELTLVTCYPFDFIGSAPDRFIVKAREVSHETSIGSSSPPFIDAALTSGVPTPVLGVPSNKIWFEVEKGHSQTLAPGISIGVDDIDTDGQFVGGKGVEGWMWIMPDRRTIWLRDRATEDPVVFYGHDDGQKRELVLTKITSHSARGFLLLKPE